VPKKTITIGEEPYTGNDNSTLQAAVDSLAYEGGGTVVIPPGTFVMKDSLHLRSGVNIQGAGRKTVLLKQPSVRVALADHHGYGHYEIVVEEPDKLEPGMGVHIRDDATGGFATTTATLLSRNGNVFHIDQMLNYDYDPANAGCVTTVFPLISGRYAENTAITNLTLDGNIKERNPINGCRGGGIFLLQSHKVLVDGLEIRNYHGDAVSFQQCTDIVVQNSHLHHNEQGGLHAGSGSVRYVMRNNHIHHNGGHGIFYCLRTTHSLCENNEIHDNALAGISLGERDTDHFIRSNEIYMNGGPGVLFRKARFHGPDRVVVHGNAVRNNCQHEGKAEIVVEKGVRDLVFRRNFCFSRGERPPQLPAVLVAPGCSRIYFFDNTVAGRAQSKGDIEDRSGCVTLQEPERPLQVGPQAAQPTSSKHLGLELPASWEDTPLRLDDFLPSTEE